MNPAPRGPITNVVVIGVLSGSLSGLFGVGGGILIVPMLVLLLGFDRRLAHGTSLAAVLPIAASGVFGFAVEGSVDWAAALPIAIGAVFGALLGTRALHLLSARTLGWAFTAVLVVSAVRLALGDTEATGRGALDMVVVAALLAVGLVAGFLAGMLGVGGGIVIVPALVVLFGVPPAVAKGTSLAVIIPTSIAGTKRNIKARNADLRVATTLGLAGLVSSFLATRISVNLDERVANALMAVLLLAVAARTAQTSAREPALARA